MVGKMGYLSIGAIFLLVLVIFGSGQLDPAFAAFSPAFSTQQCELAFEDILEILDGRKPTPADIENVRRCSPEALDGYFESHFRGTLSTEKDLCLDRQADLSSDGDVNSNDIAILLSDWGCSNCEADINNDNFADAEDASIILNNWGDVEDVEGFFEICDAFDLEAIGDLENVEEDLIASYIQMNDIDLGNGFEPIGSEIFPIAFRGTYDGNGFAINGMNFERDEIYSGLFTTTIGATLKNVNLIDVSVQGTDYVGALVGKVRGGTIENIRVSGDVQGEHYVGGVVGYTDNTGIDLLKHQQGSVTGDQNVGGNIGYMLAGSLSRGSALQVDVSGHEVIGGVVGYALGADIDDSSANALITADIRGGGLVGYLDDALIDNSYALGDVEADFNSGGLVGYSKEGTIKRSYATGDVTGVNQVGGLLGYGAVDSLVEESYSTGSVDGLLQQIGGLVGAAAETTILRSYTTGNVEGGSISSLVGGLAGYGRNAYISDSYATGDVSGQNSVGGLVGQLILGIDGASTIERSYSIGSVTGDTFGGLIGGDTGQDLVVSSYWNIETSGTSQSSGGEGRTTIQMTSVPQPRNVYVDWDFKGVWGQENGNYPALLWQN